MNEDAAKGHQEKDKISTKLNGYLDEVLHSQSGQDFFRRMNEASDSRSKTVLIWDIKKQEISIADKMRLFAVAVHPDLKLESDLQEIVLDSLKDVLYRGDEDVSVEDKEAAAYVMGFIVGSSPDDSLVYAAAYGAAQEGINLGSILSERIQRSTGEEKRFLSDLLETINEMDSRVFQEM